MKIAINGDARETTARNVAELIEHLGLPAPTLLVEHNGTALHRNEWTTTVLRDGDVLELLRVAAGG